MGVEHLRPHKRRTIKERVFDWNNLFYSCPHCNIMKKEAIYDDKIIDCCAEEPESLLMHVFTEGKVQIHSRKDDEKVRMTADLIQCCFEKKNTGIREVACHHRVQKLSTAMNILYKTLEKYKKNPESTRYQKSLKQMLSRESAFAAFKRHYVRERLEDYPELKQYVELVP